MQDAELFYGYRGSHPAVRCLSAFEFARLWTPQLARYRRSRGIGAQELHAELTNAGAAKVAREGSSVRLEPGRDYCVLEGGGADWLPFPDEPETRDLRHDWVMVRRRRPVVPVFSAAPMPKHRPGEEERNALITMAYFHPWTLLASCASEATPLAGALCGEAASWTAALQAWLRRGAVCHAQHLYLQNFLNVTRARPIGRADASDDSESLTDEELVLPDELLEKALGTHAIRQRQRGVR